MPPISENRLDKELAAAGKRLVQTPPLRDELLPLLNHIEDLLCEVEQSPAKSRLYALSPVMKALVMENLTKHSNVDVKVGLASCISEITRITAPECPYDDEKMKNVFQLIVSSFENLSHISSISYDKRAKILETMAKVRSYSIMMDLEFDQMIIEMFQHFLKAIREDHADVIFEHMETIMTNVLEESEDISTELLAPILATLKRNNKAATPITKKLGERVLQNLTDKLRPCLRRAVKSLDTSLDDYSEVVSRVCGENTGTVGCSNESISNDQSRADSNSQRDENSNIKTESDDCSAESPVSTDTQESVKVLEIPDMEWKACMNVDVGEGADPSYEQTRQDKGKRIASSLDPSSKKSRKAFVPNDIKLPKSFLSSMPTNILSQNTDFLPMYAADLRAELEAKDKELLKVASDLKIATAEMAVLKRRLEAFEQTQRYLISHYQRREEGGVEASVGQRLHHNITDFKPSPVFGGGDRQAAHEGYISPGLPPAKEPAHHQPPLSQTGTPDSKGCLL